MLTLATKEKLNIHVIGTGGTGGYAIEYLTRLLAGGDHTIHMYDGDVVEPKNLKRQNFTADELDKNKATALKDRLMKNILQAPELVDHPAYITDKDEFLADVITTLEDDETLVVVLAVDNIATRKLINEVVLNDLVEIQTPAIVLDSGNDNQGGQVVLYANAPITHTEPLKENTKGMLPTMLQIFPKLDTIIDTNPGLVMNCADNAESQPQAMMCNVRNGELLAHIIFQAYESHKAPGNLWRSDILTGNTTNTFTGFV